MAHTDKDGQSKLLEECNLPLTGVNCIKQVVTDLAVVDIENGHFIIRETAPGISAEKVLELTEGNCVIADDCER